MDCNYEGVKSTSDAPHQRIRRNQKTGTRKLPFLCLGRKTVNHIIRRMLKPHFTQRSCIAVEKMSQAMVEIRQIIIKQANVKVSQISGHSYMNLKKANKTMTPLALSSPLP